MHTQYYKEYSHNLGRDMEFKVYGHAGQPIVVFPCQDGNFYDFEDRGMINLVANHIEAGRLQLICVSSIDKETWSASMGNTMEELCGMNNGSNIFVMNLCLAYMKFVVELKMIHIMVKSFFQELAWVDITV